MMCLAWNSKQCYPQDGIGPAVVALEPECPSMFWLWLIAGVAVVGWAGKKERGKS